MANELVISSIISGTKAIQSYARNGLEVASNPIKDYVRFYRKGLALNEFINITYPKSDLELIHGLVYGTTYNWKLELMDAVSAVYFNSTTTTNYLSIPHLILPKGHTAKITNLGAEISYLIINATQVYILEDINLK